MNDAGTVQTGGRVQLILKYAFLVWPTAQSVQTDFSDAGMGIVFQQRFKILRIVFIGKPRVRSDKGNNAGMFCASPMTFRASCGCVEAQKKAVTPLFPPV